MFSNNKIEVEVNKDLPSEVFTSEGKSEVNTSKNSIFIHLYFWTFVQKYIFLGKGIFKIVVILFRVG